MHEAPNPATPSQAEREILAELKRLRADVAYLHCLVRQARDAAIGAEVMAQSARDWAMDGG